MVLKLGMILSVVSEVVGVTVEEIRSYSRSSSVKKARGVFFAVAKERGFDTLDIARIAHKHEATVKKSTFWDQGLLKEVRDALTALEVKMEPVVEAPRRELPEGSPFSIVDISSTFYGPGFMLMENGIPIGFEDDYNTAYSKVIPQSVEKEEVELEN